AMRSSGRHASSFTSRVAHVRRTGAKIRAPPASPSHQVDQIGPRSPHAASPESASVAVPMVALTTVLTRAPRNANLKTFCGRSNARAPFAKRVTRYAPTSASRVFPTAIPAEETGSPVVVRFVKNAPSSTPGQTRIPSRSSAASESPVGGQTAVVLVFTKARPSPNFPATKYAAASPMIDAVHVTARPLGDTRGRAIAAASLGLGDPQHHGRIAPEAFKSV